MKPYYESGGITLYCADCRDFTDWPVADAVVTDPPYGTEALNGGYGRAGTKIANDGDLSALTGFLGSYAPSGWLAAFAACRRRRQAEDAIMAAGWTLRGEAVWDKGRPSLGYTVRYCHEPIIIASATSDMRPVAPLLSVLTGYRTTEVMAKRHPHEKPVEVMGRLIEFCVSPAGLVLDPFAGSGSTLRAAKDLGRRAVGFEVDERWCEMAAERLSQEVLAL